MTDKKTIEILRTTAMSIFAGRGYDGLSMRTLSAESGIGLSSIYHFFANKDLLLKDIFDLTNTRLGEQRRQLRDRPTAEAMLRDRILFQFEHMEDIVFVLKYYLQFRDDYMKLPGKILPPKAYLHIEEVIYKGMSTGEYGLRPAQVETQAKIITHSINGFLLEYYPYIPKSSERSQLVTDLTAFVTRALAYKEVPMEQKV